MNSPVEQIKSRLNIIDVIQNYLRLQKAGVNYRALCPFHSEKTPSFFVSPARESWHCFGCNRGGDIFSFVMEIEGVEFLEALKILAERAGVELKPLDQKYKSERVRLLQLMEEAKKFYEGELKKNKEAISYLKERGLKGETAKSFNIGFAPGPPAGGWRNLHGFLKNKNYLDSEIEKSGMAIRGEKGYYDRFRNRIMFPLNNSAGQVVGFSGRIFPAQGGSASGGGDGMGKYINTPQTILYDKSKILYGFDKAKIEIKKKDRCVLTEGQMDVIMSHQAGLANTVAVSGTALTAGHLAAINRLTDNLTIAFDKDEAGLSAAGRGIDTALAEGFNVKIATVSFGKDPADAIKENPGEWKKVLEKAKNVIEFYLDLFKGDRKKIEKIVLPYVSVLPSEMEKAHWAREIAGHLRIGEEAVWEELRKVPKGVSFVPKEPPLGEIQKPLNRLHLLKNRLIGFIFWQKNSDDREFKSSVDNFVKNEHFDLNDLDIPQEQVIFETEIFYTGAESLKEEFEKLASEFKKEKIKVELAAITEKIKDFEITKDDKEIDGYLNKFHDLAKKLNEFR